MQFSEIKPYEKNAKKHPKKQIEDLANIVREVGWRQPVLVNGKGIIIVGHGRHETYMKYGESHKLKELWVINDKGETIFGEAEKKELTPEQEMAYRIADNKLAESDWNMKLLVPELKELHDTGFNLELLGFTEDILRESEWKEEQKTSLREDFIIPPFSVWDTKQKYWQDRKRRWQDFFGDSRDGRDDNLLGEGLKKLAVLTGKKQRGGSYLSGTSEFDPVIADICYRWFSPERSRILDPFAGGIVRGAVAGVLGHEYHGIDLSKRQIFSNEKKAKELFEEDEKPQEKIEEDKREDITDPTALTPVQERGGYYFKREDFFVCNGVRGAKVRGCYLLVEKELKKDKEIKGATTAGSRQSPQINILAKVADHFKIKTEAHTPEGILSDELQKAKEGGAKIIQHKAGYNNVIIARAREASEKNGYINVPFGMESEEAIENTAKQVENIPDAIKRIVVPVGSGINLAGIIRGKIKFKKKFEILGITVGKNPKKLLDKYVPEWEDHVELKKSGEDYHTSVEAEIAGITLDPIYEAKCKRFIKKGDLFWIIGIRQTAKEVKPKIRNSVLDGDVNYHYGNSIDLDKMVEGEFDLIFSCPPYYDLEEYNDGDGDLSMKSNYEEFLKDYKEIIKRSVARLKDDRFAIFTVGDIRDKAGYYRGFVKDTIEAFEEAGMKFYNDIILVNAITTASVRSRRPFTQNRKVTKVHQNILAFYKGDEKNIKKSLEQLPKIERYHQNIVVFYKGEIKEIKKNYKVVGNELTI